MNILLISNKATYPPDGGNIAILNLAKGYAKLNHKITLLNMITHKHINKPDIIRELKQRNIEIIGVKVKTRISIFKLFFNLLFSDKPYNLERFNSKKFSDQIISLLNREHWDFIQIEGLYVSQYISIIRKHFNGKIVFRSHNIEHIIWEENSSFSNSRIKKLYFKLLAKRLKKFELKTINNYDFILPISSVDAEFYKSNKNNKPILITPFGIDPEIYDEILNQTHLNSSSPNILFIGSLNWIPNQDGLIWFTDNCLPLIREQIPLTKLIVAGRNAPKWFKKHIENKGCQIIENVENAHSFLLTDGIFIVPLFSGSGMRVKIIEAMALRKAIVSSPKGSEGINCTEKEISIAETPQEFANSIIHLLNNRLQQNNLGNSAQELIKSDYNINKIADSVINFITNK